MFLDEIFIEFFFEKISVNFFFKKTFRPKTHFMGSQGQKKGVCQQKTLVEKTISRDLAIFGPAAPGKPPGRAAGAPKRYFGHKNGHTGRFPGLKTFFRGFAGCPTVLEGSQTVGDQLWAPLDRLCKVAAGEELSTV